MQIIKRFASGSINNRIMPANQHTSGIRLPFNKCVYITAGRKQHPTRSNKQND